jgi:short subunit dehydrogenase-like uncharacterized protein
MSSAEAAIMSELSPLLKDQKKLPLADLSEAIPWFLVYLCLVLPLLIFVLLPLTLITTLAKKIGELLAHDKSKSEQGYPPPFEFNGLPPKPSERPYDIIIFGATGFTGGLAAQYMAKVYGYKGTGDDKETVSWAIAGRKHDRLVNVIAGLSRINSSCAEVPIVLADVTDVESIVNMVRSTKVVLTTAGPFDKYGEVVAAACAHFGTHYCDITGESDFVRRIVDRYDDKARATGAQIVSHCGHDCIPWDLCVHHLSSHLNARGDVLERVQCFNEIRATASGGTIATVIQGLSNRRKYKARLGFDPLLKMTGDVGKSSSKFMVKNQSFLGYSSLFRSWVGPFFMSAVMANCVRRSNALACYSQEMSYGEAVVYPSFFAGFVTVVHDYLLGFMFVNPILRSAAKTLRILPEPGEGPSEKAMDAGFLQVTAFGTGLRGGQAKAAMYFPTDPGYRDTARMAVESGLALAAMPRGSASGGVISPAFSMGDALTARLVRTGCTFEIDSL